MTWNDLALLLAMLGGASLAAAWLNRQSDEKRDTVFMTVVGATKMALAMGLYLTAAEA